MEINIIITKEVIDEVLLHKTTRYNRLWSSLFGDGFQAIWAFDMLDQTTLMLIDGGEWSWSDLGKSVVEGAFTGGIAGSYGGSVTLPIVGTVGGGTGGAIIGGVVGLIDYLFFGWW